MTSEREQVVRAVEAYLEGLGRCDLSDVPFAPDVTIEGPLEDAKAAGREGVVELLTGVFPLIKGIEIRHHIVEPPFCATLFDFETIFGTIEVFDRFRVENGQLKSIRPYYDPRLITEAILDELTGDAMPAKVTTAGERKWLRNAIRSLAPLRRT